MGEFKKVFYEEYFLRSYRHKKRSEFLQLVQGSMTVVECQKKYIELSKYATTIIKDEINRCKRFEDGLREEIRTCTTVVECKGFGKLIGLELLQICRRKSKGDWKKIQTGTKSTKELCI